MFDVCLELDADLIENINHIYCYLLSVAMSMKCLEPNLDEKMDGEDNDDEWIEQEIQRELNTLPQEIDDIEEEYNFEEIDDSPFQVLVSAQWILISLFYMCVHIWYDKKFTMSQNINWGLRIFVQHSAMCIQLHTPMS